MSFQKILVFVLLFSQASYSQVQSTCNLKSSDVARKVILVGENHKAELSLTFKKRLFEAARDGRVIVATEVGEEWGAFSWSDKTIKDFYMIENGAERIHGIESTVFYPLAISYQLQRDNLSVSFVAGLMRYFAYHIKYLPLFRGAYESLRTQKKYADAYTRMDAELSLLKEPFEATHDFILPIISSREETLMRALFTDLHKEMINLVKSNFPEKLKGKKLPYYETRADIEMAARAKTDLVFVNERDIDFVAKISDLLCDYANTPLPFVVVVGDAHAPGVQKLLKSLSSGKVKVQYFKSYDPNQIRDLLKAIADYHD